MQALLIYFKLQIEFHCINTTFISDLAEGQILFCYYKLHCNEYALSDKYLLHVCKNFPISQFQGVGLLDCRAYICVVVLNFTKSLPGVVVCLMENSKQKYI